MRAWNAYLLPATILLAACVPAPSTQAPQPPPAPTESQAPAGARTADGRTLLSIESARWCYRMPDVNDEGGCFTMREACTQARNDHAKWWLGRLVAKMEVDPATMPKERWRSLVDTAFDSFTPCEEGTAYACFSGTEILSGEAFELCFPSIAQCDSTLYRQRSVSDVRPQEDSRCYVYRR
jgi:hypothetical protein